MPEIKINVTDFQLAVLAHRHIDVNVFAEDRILSETNRYINDLANRLIQAGLESDNKDPKPMDRELIIQEMLDAEGYRNAANREDDRVAAESASNPTPDRVIV